MHFYSFMYRQVKHTEGSLDEFTDVIKTAGMQDAWAVIISDVTLGDNDVTRIYQTLVEKHLIKNN